MKRNIYNIDGEPQGEMDLPAPFEEEIRPDLIRRAVETTEANKKQPYGPSPEAGMRHATEMEGIGQGMARVQRLTQGGSRAAESPQTRGGRKAHPPKPEKDLGKKLNQREKIKARRSALAAMKVREFVEDRGHEINNSSLDTPVIIEKKMENLEKTKEAVDLLKSLDIYDDVKRAKEGKNIRSGKGKIRNRKYKSPKSLLVVLPEDAKGKRAFSNLPGVTVKDPINLTIEDMAPGGDIARLTLFSVKALNQLEDW